MKYSVITFGCRVNQADSLGFEEELSRAGAAAASPEEADLVVVNTCSVTATADQGARQTIRRIARANPDARIVVTGCYATRRPAEVARCRTSFASFRTTTSRDWSRSWSLRRSRTILDRRAVRRRRRKLRRRDRARRRRPDGVHAARADRVRRAVLVLHHPVDARAAAERAARRRAARGRAGRRGRLQGDRADRRAPGIVRPRSRRRVHRCSSCCVGACRRRPQADVLFRDQLARADGLFPRDRRSGRRVTTASRRTSICRCSMRATACSPRCAARTRSRSTAGAGRRHPRAHSRTPRSAPTSSSAFPARPTTTSSSSRRISRARR